jgi:hypothetical protein
MWTYEQDSGFLITPEGVKLFPPGYAGKGEGKNNPQMQDVVSVGPLPCGFYTATELIQDDPQTGQYTIVLTPDAENEMFGRSGFRCHGENPAHPGDSSDGCIVQIRPNRMEFWESPDHRLQVIATAVAPLANPVSDVEIGM